MDIQGLKDGKMIDCNAEYWYVLRVSYGRVLKISAALEDKGICNFVPMIRRNIEKDGKRMTVTVPAVSNLCFVHSSRAVIDEFLISMGDNRHVHYFWDKATRQPVIVPDKSMRDFMQISRVMSDDLLYLKNITSKLNEGQKVRVINGPFKGIEGTVLRVKRSRRVIVDFPGMIAIATAYIKPGDLELL